MATLIAHSPEPATQAIAQQLADVLRTHRGVTTVLEDLSRAGRYVDNVDAVVVVAPADEETFHRGARNFMAAQYAELADKSLFVAALGSTDRLTETQQAAMDAFDPRDTAYFRTDALDETALTDWAGLINTRGAS